MVDVVIQGARVLYHINKDKGDESQCNSDFVNVIFLKYSKEGRFSSSHLEIQNILSNVYYDDTKWPGAIWTQAYSVPLRISKSGCFRVNS